MCSLRVLPIPLRDIGSCCALSPAGGQRVRVVLEATGLYALDLALLLSAHQQVQLMVANPRAVRHFAQAMMQRSKNDQLDAVVLLEFAECMPFTPWVRPMNNTLALGHCAAVASVDQTVHGGEKSRSCHGPFGSDSRHGATSQSCDDRIEPMRPRVLGEDGLMVLNHSVSFVLWTSLSEHGRATVRLLFCGLILNDIPM